MAVFPRLSTGAVSQYPSRRQSGYATVIKRFVDGGEQRFRELNAPVRKWTVHLQQLSPLEASAIELFFTDMQGQFSSFAFIDPWDESEHEDCSFDSETVQMLASADADHQMHLIIRDNKP